MKKMFISRDEKRTAQIAANFALLAKKGDVIALHGTLGMGKSVFARSFIQQLCGTEEVPSPTFTLVQIYSAPDFEIYHYDLYRLKSPEEIFELGIEDAFYDGVCLVEWPEKMAGYAPRDMWHINIETDDEGRKITIFADNKDKIQRLEAWKMEN